MRFGDFRMRAARTGTSKQTTTRMAIWTGEEVVSDVSSELVSASEAERAACAAR